MSGLPPRPPRWSEALLALFLRGDVGEQVLGDLHEEWTRREARFGRAAADRWYRRAAVASLAARWIMRALGERAGPAASASGVDGIRGTTRRMGTMTDQTMQDVRFALRSLVRRPAFAAVSTLTVAIGVGATVGVFTLANWLLFRPIPGVASMDGLVALGLESTERAGGVTGMSLPNLRDVRAASPAAEYLGAWQLTLADVSVDGGAPRRIEGHTVTEHYFDALGVVAHLGRLLDDAEFAGIAPANVAVLSERLWRAEFEADPGVVGASVRLNGYPHEIVGVAGGGFRGPDRLGTADFWVPIHDYGALRHQPDYFDVSRRDRSPLFNLVGRLQPGAEPATLQEQVDVAIANLAAAYPDENEQFSVYRLVVRDVGLRRWAVDRARSLFALLGAGGALVLLIACANVANLLLVHGNRRRGELAVRQAMGASAGRIVRQRLVEALLLAGLGGALGVALASLALRGLSGVSLWNLPPLGAVTPDARVAAFAVAVSLAAGLLFGALPALDARRGDVTERLKGIGRSGSRAGGAARSSLTVAQMALSLTLLIGALLLARSLVSLRSVELGFEPEGVSYYHVDPSRTGMLREEIHALVGRLRDAVGADPRVVATSATASRPFWIARLTRISAGGDASPYEARSVAIEGDHFRALGVPLLRGRPFSAAEEIVPFRARSGVILVSRSLAETVFGSTDAVGRTLERPDGGQDTRQVIVGVVEDARYEDVRAPAPLVVYEPRQASYQEFFHLWVRSPGPPDARDAMVRSALNELAPNVPLIQAGTLDTLVDAHLAEERLMTVLLMTLAGLATLLAGVGLYGTMSSRVVERVREIGIRVALGARPAEVSALVLRGSLRILVGALAVGIAVAWASGRVLESRLFGVSAHDPGVYAAAALGCALLALLGSWVPLRGATRVDPVRALRSD